jgi:hypothetical protein
VIAALFAVAFAALPSTGEGSWVELSAAVRIDVGTLNKPYSLSMPLTTGGWVGGGAMASIDVFGRRVVDDDAAPALQPFLQRVARFGLEGGGGQVDITFPIYTLDPAAPSAFLVRYRGTEETGRVAARAEGYLRRWLHGALRFGIDYARWGQLVSGQNIGGFGNVTPVSSGTNAALQNSELELSGAASAGIRWRDLLLSAGWSVTAFRLGSDALQVRFWGRAFVDLHAVVRRFVALDARVDALDGGAAAQGSVTVWLRRRYGLSAGAEGGHGAFGDSSAVSDRAGGHVGISAWLTPRLAMTLAYAASWQHPTPISGFGVVEPDGSSVAHIITLTGTVRPR